MIPSSLFILASSVCKSLQCLISALTQGSEDGHLFRLTRSVLLWGWRNTANKYHWHVWEVLTVSGPHWVCPHSWHMCFPGLHCLGSRLLFRGTVQTGLCALPRSKLLRFRFSGTPQRHRLGLSMCLVSFPGPSSSGNQVLASALSQVGCAS